MNLKKQTYTLLLLCTTLATQAQYFFTNTGFEEWDSTSMYNNPKNWFTLNDLTLVGFESSTRITTDARLGKFAVELISVEGQFNNVAGIVATGPLLNQNLMPDFNLLKRAYTSRPYGLQFSYKSFPAVGDTCALIMLLTRWNVATQQDDTIGIASFSTGDTALEYIDKLVPFEYYSDELPDSAYFIATSSLDGFNPKPGSTFILDNISLQEFRTSLTNRLHTPSITLYPNPATEVLHVSIQDISETGIITLYDLTGKVIYQTQADLKNHTIPIANWSPGMYTIHIQTNRFTLRDKFLHQ